MILMFWLINFIIYFTSLKYITNESCVKLVKYFRRTHVGQLQYLFYKKIKFYTTEMYEHILGCVVIHQMLVEANATCKKFCRRIKWRNIQLALE
jgi:hypothetical protein